MTLPGGDLAIEWRESDDHVLMTGPVEFEFEGTFDPALFRQSGRGMSVDVVTFGCRLNAYESEVIRREAVGRGVADAVVVNTCAVTGEAVRQARQTIRKLRRERPDAQIVVTGCAAQTEPRDFAAMPEVDRVLGNEEKLSAASWAALDAAEKIAVGDIMAVTQTAPHRIDGIEGHTRAFLQVQNGCDHRCTFCIIPFGRGNSRSVPMDDVVAQARRLVENGHREIVLTGVDITSYAPGLGLLVKQILREVPELKRLRLSSIDSVEADADLLDALANDARLMPHLHLSLQAGDDMILKRMKRRHSRADAIAFCDQVRRLRPDVVFGGDIIAGFPTETEDDVRPLARSGRRMRADAPARVSVLAAARHAGRAHAAGRGRCDQGARPPAAREGRGGAAPSSRRRGRRAPPRADRARRHRPHRAVHAGAARRAGRAGR